MSEVNLLPLPPLPEKESDERGEEWIEPQIEAYATAYARANMEPLIAENERLRADAERYRWIRSSRTTAELEIVLNHEGGVLDAAIDQARGKGGAGK